VPKESKLTAEAVHAHKYGPEKPTPAAEFIHMHKIVLQESRKIQPAAEAFHVHKMKSRTTAGEFRMLL